MAVEKVRGLSEDVRAWLAAQLLLRVVGPQGPARHRQIFSADGERWFAEDRPIRRVHSDAAMFVGGLRALLLQSLHPLVMAGVAQHSRYREDPWGRLQQTSFFLAVTTFGPAQEAERAVARVRGVHNRVQGTAADGRTYAASDPHLLRWVHVAEVDSFLAAYQRYGVGGRLDQGERDAYVADTAVVASRLGIVDAPRIESELRQQLHDYRRELAGTPEARDAARYLLLRPPLPLVGRVPYSALAAAALDLMPAWTRWPLRLPYLPTAEATVGRLAGRSVVAGLHWATSRPTPDSSRAHG
jgi:uncharacterized protein (DUF2236 family)